MLVQNRILEDLKRDVSRALNNYAVSMRNQEENFLCPPTVPLLLNSNELKMLGDILSKVPTQDIEDKINRDKKLYFILLTGDSFCRYAYYHDNNEFSQHPDCKLFNSKEEAKKALDVDDVMEIANNFCEQNHWELRNLKIVPCRYSLETFNYQLKLSCLDLRYIASNLTSAWGEITCHGPSDNPFFLKALRDITYELLPILTAYVPKDSEYLGQFIY